MNDFQVLDSLVKQRIAKLEQDRAELFAALEELIGACDAYASTCTSATGQDFGSKYQAMIRFDQAEDAGRNAIAKAKEQS